MQVILNVDVIRMTKDPANSWRYENAGTVSGLLNTTSAVGLTDLPATQSKTGVAFYQNDDEIKLFDVGPTSELWVKLDAYSTEDGSWHLQDYSTGSMTGIHASSSTAYFDPLALSVFNRTSEIATLNDILSIDTLQTFLLHMKAHAINGLIEVYTADHGLVYSYTGEVNSGQPFSTLDLVSSLNEDWDPPKAGDSFFSNIIISNQPLWLDDDVSAEVIDVDLSVDAERNLVIAVDLALDLQRELYASISYTVDAIRQLPYSVVIEGDEVTPIPITPNGDGIQSINIHMSEQQVTDRVSFVHAGNCNIMDKIQGTYRDYVFDLRIEETDRQGILQTCSCCSDIDELLYSQIAYTIPENKYEWSEDYLEMLGIVQEENPGEDIDAQPTTTTEEHLRTIAGILGKNLVYRGVKFYSTNNVNENGGKTYASVISELIGWSSRLPHMEINAYFRNNTLYVIQRGHEANTVSLAGAKIANLRVNRKIVRTTWGSDVKSESTVDTFINSWQELELEPYTPSGGGGGTTTYNGNGLVETTTTESESEKTETTYHYKTGVNGEKYLAYEETVKYEKSINGGWTEYDRITTTHDRVSTTQSHIYAENADGEIVGEVVSPNRFDDRATPYDLGHGSGSRGFILLHDSQGNTYKCYSIAYYSEQMEKGTRTTYGLSLVDTSFPLYGEDCLTYLTQQLMWLNRKTEETVSLDVYDVDHVIGFDDKISYNGATYYLRSNNVLQDERTVNKQSLVMVRWF